MRNNTASTHASPAQFYNYATTHAAIRLPKSVDIATTTRCAVPKPTSQIITTHTHAIRSSEVQRHRPHEITQFQISRPAEMPQVEHAETFKVQQHCGLNAEDVFQTYGKAQRELGAEEKLRRLEQAHNRAQRRKEAEARVLSSYARDDAHMAELNKNKLRKIQETRERYIRNLAEEEKERHLELM